VSSERQFEYGVRLFEEMCVGCRSCTVACQSVRGLAKDTTPLVISITEENSHRGPHLRLAAEACRNCSDAPCAEVCPTETIVIQEDGRVVLYEEDCINCGACADACPYGAMYMDEERELAVKCDLCGARTEAGLEPACVSTCPGKAIYAGKLSEINADIERRRAAMVEARQRVAAEASR
jgi:Fe-S-cluster-containing dehydrogenase component